MNKWLLSLFFCISILSQNGFGQKNEGLQPWGNWIKWGDQKNGTYINPILPADYSDIDCIRVSADYYAISSTFQFSPGVVILRSKDLINWDIIGHAVPDISTIGTEMNWDKMDRYGKGIWAGAIRYHDHQFWIYFGTPNEGYFMTKATNADGPWAPLKQVLKSSGWDDCCPFWDEDGQGYLVGTNYSDGYKIHLFKMTNDGTALIPGSDQIIHQSKGSEANKLYKINGWYYHLFSEVKPEGRAVMMERSKNIFGPYNEIRQLSHAEKPAHEPNQGGLVQTEKGDWYFLTHHGSGGDWSGRNMSLLPVTWVDGWPIIGGVGADTIGHMVWQGKIPIKGIKKNLANKEEDFKDAQLAPQWEWNYQPRAEKYSLTERSGWLRLKAFKPLERGNLFKAGNTLTERCFRTEKNEVVIKMDISNMANGEAAGLCHFAYPNYAWLGIIKEGDSLRIAFNLKGIISKGNGVNGNIIWIKSTWGLSGESQYAYSFDGKKFTKMGSIYQLSWGSYRGDRIGVFNYNNDADIGSVDVDFFHYTY